MDTMSQSIEAIRARYRPERIGTLLVGESAPARGRFFYSDDETAFARHIRRAMQAAGLLPDAIGHREFLDHFKSCGWYLDDLVLEPVDDWKKPERKAAWRAARASLATRLRDYQPRAIVALLMCIEVVVQQAADEARSDASCSPRRSPATGIRSNSASGWRSSFHSFQRWTAHDPHRHHTRR